jgi:hypothetical protein
MTPKIVKDGTPDQRAFLHASRRETKSSKMARPINALFCRRIEDRASNIENRRPQVAKKRPGVPKTP